MAYEVVILPEALRQLAHFPKQEQRHIRERIDRLRSNPRPSGVKLLRDRQELFRLRVGDCRILYEIEDELLIVSVIRIAHRREVYRRLH